MIRIMDGFLVNRIGRFSHWSKISSLAWARFSNALAALSMFLFAMLVPKFSVYAALLLFLSLFIEYMMMEAKKKFDAGNFKKGIYLSVG